MNLDDIIRYENESTWLDFKSIEYKNSYQQSALIKDVVSMANATVEGTRYIIVGVDLSNGERKFIGVQKPLVDSAIYQNLIHQKVEPEIDLKYYEYPFEGVTLGVFEISNCADQPYMLKAEYEKLKKGDCFIRKGSTQLPFMRADLDKIFEKRANSAFFQDDAVIYFSKNSKEELDLPVQSGYRLPSEREQRFIEAAIERIKDNKTTLISGLLAGLAGTSGRGYDQMSENQLQTELKNVKKNFKKHDDHFLHEKLATKLNFTIKATGSSYIEDSTVFLYIDDIEGLVIPEDIVDDPDNGMLNMRFRHDPQYPNVEKINGRYKIHAQPGDIKHQLNSKIFEEELRLFVSPVLKGKSIALHFEVFGKNLKQPIRKQLTLNLL